jgi:acyl-coenzyme A thioesterase PaaI-like protein
MLFTEQTISQMNDNPLYNTLGIRIEKAAEGQAKSRLEPSPEVCWPFQGQPHGGMSQLTPGYSCSTINLDIHYTRPAKGNLFYCAAEISHQTTRYSFVRSEIHDADGRLLALGQATFAIIEMEIRH